MKLRDKETENKGIKISGTNLKFISCEICEDKY